MAVMWQKMGSGRSVRRRNEAFFPPCIRRRILLQRPLLSSLTKNGHFRGEGKTRADVFSLPAAVISRRAALNSSASARTRSKRRRHRRQRRRQRRQRRRQRNEKVREETQREMKICFLLIGHNQGIKNARERRIDHSRSSTDLSATPLKKKKDGLPL